MNVQISAITLGVSDLERAKTFYSEGLGCPIDKDYGEFAGLSLGGVSSTLSLYRWDTLAADAGVAAEGSGFRDFTMSYLVDTAEQVDEVMAAAERAGATISKPAKRAMWGGYSGYFTDPDGYHWKVASTSGPPLIGRRSQARSAHEGPAPKAKETCVTIGVDIIKRTKQFYCEGLGCKVD